MIKPDDSKILAETANDVKWLVELSYKNAEQHQEILDEISKVRGIANSNSAWIHALRAGGSILAAAVLGLVGFLFTHISGKI